MKETWYFYDDTCAHSPYFNMAMDEVLLENVCQRLPHVLIRIYYWDCKAASIGFAQRWGIVPQDYACVRRLTGGGVVFHDVDLTYTLVVPEANALSQLPTEQCYFEIHKALTDELQRRGIHTQLLNDKVVHPDTSVMQCFTEPSRYDIVNGTQKFAGAAQRRTRHGILHQGSCALSFCGGDALLVKDVILHGFARAFNIDYQAFAPDETRVLRAQLLGENKYASDLWSQRRRYTEEMS